MQTIELIKSKTEELKEKCLNQLFAPESEEADIFPVSEDYELAAKMMNTNPAFVKAIDEAFQSLIEDIVDFIGEDLKSIWQRLDELEARLPEE